MNVFPSPMNIRIEYRMQKRMRSESIDRWRMEIATCDKDSLRSYLFTKGDMEAWLNTDGWKERSNVCVWMSIQRGNEWIKMDT